MCNSAKRPGFTLVELLVVIMVAVEAAVVEVLTNPVLHARLHDTLPKPASPLKRVAAAVSLGASTVWGWIKAGCKKVTGWGSKAYRKTAEAVVACTGPVGAKVASVSRTAKALLKGAWSRTLSVLALAGRMRKAVLLALAAGLTLGTACYFSGPVLSSLISGVTGFVSTMAAGTWKMLANLLAGDEAHGT
jgi:prepilin-type N-terminal cleavage/methylation domain-containing protein